MCHLLSFLPSLQTTNADAAAFLSNVIPNSSDPECSQDFYSGPIFHEETVQSQNDSPDELEAKANKCRLCDKVYARPSTLRTHMRTHSGEKPYQCHICMKSFSQDANLTAHLRIHSGEKPFKCLICDRRYDKVGPQFVHLSFVLQLYKWSSDMKTFIGYQSFP